MKGCENAVSVAQLQGPCGRQRKWSYPGQGERKAKSEVTLDFIVQI